MKCFRCDTDVKDGIGVCPNCGQNLTDTAEEKKDYKNVVIILLVIIVVLLVAILLYLVVSKSTVKDDNDQTDSIKTSNTTVKTTAVLTREDKIIKNFINDIEKVKNGENVEYIMCDLDSGIDCTKINEFEITDVNYYPDYDKDPYVYKISYKFDCLDDDMCFYNEQFDDSDDDTDVGSSYYQVDEDGNIIKILGNSYPSLYVD